MFELLFRYPIPVFTKGKYILLSSWPVWVLLLLIVDVAVLLAWLTWRRLPQAAPRIRNWRGWTIWGLEVALISLLLLLLWEPAISVAELRSQQNIIAVLLDDSRSMAIPDSVRDGRTPRETAAIGALGGVLAGLAKRFQVREYRLDSRVTRVNTRAAVQPQAAATHMNEGIRQLLDETSELPVGAVVLASDGAENTGGIDLDTIRRLQERRLPVHTIGFGKEKLAHDLEVDDVSVAPKAMANSRVAVTVTFHQRGYAGQHTVLDARDGEHTVAAKDVTLAPDGVSQSETFFFDAGDAGVKTIRFSLGALPNEENTENNAVTRLLDVSGAKRRILYVEGEPRWEYKFLRRAEEDDKNVQVVSMLRTTENKIYRQGISDPSELVDGFPSRAEDLFQYQAIIVGSVEAGYFTPGQQELLREFVDKRGGGVLFLGGRFALGQGGWATSGAADLLPTFLPSDSNSFHRDAATVELTAAGAESPITRIVEDRGKNIDRWKKLPYLADYQEIGTPKPGATVLAELTSPHREPLLVTERYGLGRTAILGTSGTWRWQMSSPLGDPSHDLFWQQLLRWLVESSPGPVTASIPKATLEDEGAVHLVSEVRNKGFDPAADAHVTAHLVGPENTSALLEMTPVPNKPGMYEADWNAHQPGGYLAEITAEQGADQLGSDVVAFRRQDGVAEHFHTEQNRALLEKLSRETGGRYWSTDDLTHLPRDISYSEAGISVRDTKELWDLPAVFLTLLGLVTAEWLLRRRWGVV